MPDPISTAPSVTPDSALPNATATAIHDPAHEPELAASAQRVAAELAALADDDLENVVLDVRAVVATVLGANRGIQALVPELATLPGYDVDAIRKLGDYTNALLYWSASAAYASAPKQDLGPKVERAIELRERTLHDLGALTRHGVLPKEPVEKLGGSVAHRDIALDLVAISNLVHERWAAIEGKSMITLAGMDELSALGQQILQALGDREFSAAEVARDVALRNRAYTLVLRTYAEARDGIAFLRRAQDDADRIAPSLYAGRRTKSKSSAASASSEPPLASAPVDALGPRTTSLIVPDGAAS